MQLALLLLLGLLPASLPFMLSPPPLLASVLKSTPLIGIEMEGIKNVRDLSSVEGSPIAPKLLYRAGMLSNATPSDIATLQTQLDIKTLVDLRSLTELKEDLSLSSSPVYDGFTDVQWSSRRTLREVRGTRNKILDPTVPRERRERHFVALMDEKKYVVGTFQRLQKRKLAKLAVTAPGAVISRRARKKGKAIFLDTINGGGLPMLNDLILQMAAKGIRYVLTLCADTSRHPIAFYCTAGKDRTGVISAVILMYLGVPDAAIVSDYAISANVYRDLDDDSAMVGALKQRDLNPEVFLGAPPAVMAQTLVEIREHYGSVEGYLDFIGFGPEDRAALKKALVPTSYKVSKV